LNHWPMHGMYFDVLTVEVSASPAAVQATRNLQRAKSNRCTLSSSDVKNYSGYSCSTVKRDSKSAWRKSDGHLLIVCMQVRHILCSSALGFRIPIPSLGCKLASKVSNDHLSYRAVKHVSRQQMPNNDAANEPSQGRAETSNNTTAHGPCRSSSGESAGDCCGSRKL
jgi:hypothetical protein